MTASPSPALPWSGEPSPWLLGHLDGPVAWQPWHPDRLREAAARDCPVLLVMASADCPPFERMARESFADPDTAAEMNAGHVCVLADARWHPVLDRQLQLAHQLLAGRAGGWPLVALLDPLDARPYFVGTYLPANASGMLPGFRDFLQQALSHHRRARPSLLAQGERLAAALARLAPVPATEPWRAEPTPLGHARQQLAAGFATTTGRFIVEQAEIAAPLAIQRLLRAWRGTAEADEPDLHALYLATRSLKAQVDAPCSDESLPSWLLARAAAAVVTGDEDFVQSAKATAATLQANLPPTHEGQPLSLRLQSLHALAMAARWLDRSDWLNQAGRDFGAFRRQTAPTALAFDEAGHALAIAATLLPVRWQAEEFRWAEAVAQQLLQQLDHPVAEGLPGLPALVLLADDSRPSPVGVALRSLHAFGRVAGEARYAAAVTQALRRIWNLATAAPARHLTVLEALADALGHPATVALPEPAPNRPLYAAKPAENDGRLS